MGRGLGVLHFKWDGYIVTNNHVVQDAKSVTVTMDNGRTLDAKVLGTDPKTDVALLKVEQPGNYPYVSFANEAPRIGDWVVAIGNPYGLGDTVTAGILSAKGRDIGDGPYDRFLQIDAPINKGNSGGPTFNERVRSSASTRRSISPSGGSVGIGFAIRLGTVQQGGGRARARRRGQTRLPWRQGSSRSARISRRPGPEEATGENVDQTMPGTPAADAGLRSGDVITKVNGKEVKDAADLTNRIGMMQPGDHIELTYLRNGQEKTASVSLSSQQSEKVASANMPSPEALGLQLAPAGEVEGASKNGVAIVGVDPAGQAAEKGSGDRRRHSRRRGQAGVDAAGREVRHRFGQTGGKIGDSDADPERQRRPLRGLLLPEGVKRLRF